MVNPQHVVAAVKAVSISSILLANIRSSRVFSHIVRISLSVFSRNLSECLCPVTPSLQHMTAWLKSPMRTRAHDQEASSSYLKNDLSASCIVLSCRGFLTFVHGLKGGLSLQTFSLVSQTLTSTSASTFAYQSRLDCRSSSPTDIISSLKFSSQV